MEFTLQKDRIMKTLKTELRKSGFTYVQMQRNEFKAMYSQYCPDAKRIIAYEVFLIQSHTGYTIAGVYIEPSESYPSNERFGITAWSIRTLSRATEKYNNLHPTKPE